MKGAYLIYKFVIHAAGEFCATHNVNPVSTPALIGVELCVYAAATILFFAVERPFLNSANALRQERTESTSKASLRYYSGELKFNLTIPNDRHRHTQRNGGYRAQLCRKLF
jgi:peptidoglycan/LPS O-acetylase OafA/YrhL